MVNEETQDIIEKIPSSFDTKLILLCLVFIGILFTLALTIKYPDSITARVNIVADQPAVIITAPYSGEIVFEEEIFERQIQEDEIIGIIRNPAKLDDILILSDSIKFLKTQTDIDIAQRTIRKLLRLEIGSIKSKVNQLYLTTLELSSLNKYKLSMIQLFQIEDQIKYQNELIKSENKQSQNVEEQFLLIKKKYETDSVLFSKNVIPRKAFENSKLNYLKAIDQKNSWETNLDKIKSSVKSLKHDYNFKNNKSKKDVEDKLLAYEKLLLEIETDISFWQDKFVITSPINGALEKLNHLSNNFFVQEGQSIAAVIPPSENYYAQALIPAIGLGKIPEEAYTQIQLFDYPAKEFGYIEGRVTSVSSIAQDSIYLGTISMPNGLTSNNSIKFSYKSNMGGTAKIITSKKTVFQRIFTKITKVFE